RRDGEEVRPTFPSALAAADQPQVGLVDQGGRLQGVAGGLASQVALGQSAQFVINQRQQFRRRGRTVVGQPLQYAWYLLVLLHKSAIRRQMRQLSRRQWSRKMPIR